MSLGLVQWNATQAGGGKDEALVETRKDGTEKENVSRDVNVAGGREGSVVLSVRNGSEMSSQKMMQRGTSSGPTILKRPRPMPVSPPVLRLAKWRKVEISDSAKFCGDFPSPRHGHRAVLYGDKMIIYGGGNEQIFNDLWVFDTVTNSWSSPEQSGDVPVGRAAFGMALLKDRLVIYGGMTERIEFLNDMLELEIKTWKWRKMSPLPPPSGGMPPCARFGHSFTVVKDFVFMFGGMANDGTKEQLMPRYLNDFYVLRLKENDGNDQGLWEIPPSFGKVPGPRESHSAVCYTTQNGNYNRVVMYGGMQGKRLGDLYLLDVDTWMWTAVPFDLLNRPQPRSLHSANVIGNRMYIFGGWVPSSVPDDNKPWNCSNELISLNLDTLKWENVCKADSTDFWPDVRAGHSAVATNTKILVCGGKFGFVRVDGKPVCHEDLLQLDVAKPTAPEKVRLIRSGVTSFEIKWAPVEGADSYILQCAMLQLGRSRASL